MAFVPLQGFQSNIALFLSNTATQMSLPASAIAEIQANITVGNFTIFAISNGSQFELVQCTGVTAGKANITRATEGTIAQTFGAGSTVRFVWTTIGIVAVTNGGAGVPINVSGAHAASVTGGPYNFVVDVPFTTVTAGSGISVSGSFPSFTITNTSPGGVVTPTVVTGSGVANVTPIIGGYNVDVPLTTLFAGSGISITGAFPNFTITNTQTPGGTGTVTSVTAGAGINVTGTPTINPTISLTPTGVTPGSYGGITVNDKGQITNVSASLITSISSTTPTLTVSTPSSGVVTLAQGVASTAQQGIVQLATPTSSASSNPADSSSAVTPAGIASVLAAQTSITVAGQGVNVPLAPATYAQSVTGITPTLVTVSAGKTALVWVSVEVVDTVTPANISQFAIGLFNGLTLLDGNSVIPGNTRVLMRQIVGPFTGNLSINSTTLGANEIFSSCYMNVIYN